MLKRSSPENVRARVTHVILVVGLMRASAFAQGSLTPPGPPAPTMKSLDQIEPRTIITNLPFTITASGSYYLVTNLTGPGGFDGITIAADDVTIDLKGFTLYGAPGAGSGIIAGARTNVAVCNGSLRGWGSSGVHAVSTFNGRFRDLFLVGNTGRGLYAGTSAQILHCHATSNTLSGIETFTQCLVQDCVVTANGRHGIFGSAQCVVAGCIASGNASNGVQCATGSLIRDSDASGNGLSGLSLPLGEGTIQKCVSSYNGSSGIIGTDHMRISDCTITYNSDLGIYAGSGCAITGCLTASNANTGIAVFSTSTVEDCIAQNNGNYGIAVDEGSIVRNCAATANLYYGISGFGAVIEGCAADLNSAGIGAGSGSAVLNCVARRNKSAGIAVTGRDCSIVGNTCAFNQINNQGSAAGIEVVFTPTFFNYGNRIEGNNVTDNNYGISVLDVGNIIIHNTARGNSLGNYSILPGNADAQVLSPGSGFVNTDPTANFAY